MYPSPAETDLPTSLSTITVTPDANDSKGPAGLRVVHSVRSPLEMANVVMSEGDYRPLDPVPPLGPIELSPPRSRHDNSD